MAYYTKKISHQALYDSFISALQGSVRTAQLNEEYSVYCHIPADLLTNVTQYCNCHGWEVQLSHLTDGQAFYKIYGWKF